MRFARSPFAILLLSSFACKSTAAKASAPGLTPTVEQSVQTEPPPEIAKKATTAPRQDVEAPDKNLRGDDTSEANEVKPAAKAKTRLGHVFANPYEEFVFRQHIDAEHKNFGTLPRQKRYKKKKFAGYLVEQRSGRKRLYDHNIFLRALFAGQLEVNDANLRESFESAIFLDIGSAILSGDGADTVRDLYEDRAIKPHLKIIASDINDKNSKKNRYIDTYRTKRKRLPFPVVEVAQTMKSADDFRRPLKLFLTPDTTAIILRSANAGPDLYYDSREVHAHLHAARSAFADKPLLYFFNKFVLYKGKEDTNFIIIGEIDPQVGINHRVATWETIDWDQRSFLEAVRINAQYLRFQK